MEENTHIYADDNGYLYDTRIDNHCIKCNTKQLMCNSLIKMDIFHSCLMRIKCMECGARFMLPEKKIHWQKENK